MERDGGQAGRQAARAAAEQLGGPADVALVFGTTGYDQRELTRAAHETLGQQCVIVGCSSEGVISGGESHEGDRAVSVLAARLDGAKAEGHLVGGYDKAPQKAAEELARRIGDARDVTGVLVFPDGLTGDCTEFVSELERRVPGVLIAGGAAGDAMTFERTYQYCGREVATGHVSALVLRGRGRLEVATSHGCTPVGPQQIITAANGGWLEQLDGQNAWEVFKSYLDDGVVDLNAEGIVHLCLGTAAQRGATRVDEPMVVRTPMALNRETGALFFPGGGIAVGQPVRMTRRDPERIRKTGAECAHRLAGDGRKTPAFVLQLDCAGRGKILFGACAADSIVAPLREQLAPYVPWAGFHTYGEIAPIAGAVAYHNYTVALCGFFDA
ncbi:MAG: FIST C-terminal domain-containing protein [Myxococcaceae bacterium]|nr:FIST C-terminal domain-containing protein [Myxococcaceae bacterium]